MARESFGDVLPREVQDVEAIGLGVHETEDNDN